jgi:hypothetical protein
MPINNNPSANQRQGGEMNLLRKNASITIDNVTAKPSKIGYRVPNARIGTWVKLWDRRKTTPTSRYNEQRNKFERARPIDCFSKKP